MDKKKRRKWLPRKTDIIPSISNACPHCGNRKQGHLETEIKTADGTIKVCICTVCKTQYRKIGESKPRPLKELETSNDCYDALPLIKKGDFTEWCPHCEEVPLMTDLTTVKFKDGIRQTYRCHNCDTLYRFE